MAMYKLSRYSDFIIRIADSAWIPVDAHNEDYQAFLAWVALGNTPAAADAATQSEADITAAKAYAKLTALVAMTPAQVQAWVTANVTNLAQAQDAIMTLAIAVSILARRM
jgi:hypothetical protein